MGEHLEYIGYRKLRSGRIHIYCPHCGRKTSNVFRQEFDPPAAVLVHEACEKCSQGCKGCISDYLDADGRWVDSDPAELERKEKR